MRYKTGILLGVLVAILSCHRTQPQRPSYRNGQTITTKQDTALLGLIELNQRLTEEADKMLAELADSTMVLDESGYWVKGLHDVDDGLKEGDVVKAHIRTYDITDSTLLCDTEEHIVVGKWQTIQSLAYVMPMLHIGDSIEMLVPWYIGYGTTGNEHVKPYTNIRIKMNINEQ